MPAGSKVADDNQARMNVLNRIEEELRNGGSVFWVFPLVRESEHFTELGSAEQVGVTVVVVGE